MRVNISEIGSVTGIYTLLPARLSETRNEPFMGHLAKTATAQAEVAIVASGTTANFAAVVEAHRRIFAFCDKHPAFVLFIDK
jgi:hypothetical protein